MREDEHHRTDGSDAGTKAGWGVHTQLVVPGFSAALAEARALRASCRQALVDRLLGRVHPRSCRSCTPDKNTADPR